MKRAFLFAALLALVLLAGVGAAQQPENPATAAIPKPIYKMGPVEEKIYRKMLKERADIEKKYRLRVTIEGTHAQKQEYHYVKRAEVSLGNYFYAEGPARPMVAPGLQAVELRARAEWYKKADRLSLYCNDERMRTRCMNLPPGVYLGRLGNSLLNGKRVQVFEIPLLVPGGIAIGGIYTTKKMVVNYVVLPFDPNRFRK